MIGSFTPQYVDKTEYFRATYSEFSLDQIILVDADTMYVKAAMKCETERQMRDYLKRSLRLVRQRCGSDNLKIAVKGDGNFRYDVYSEYKGNRKPFDEKIGDLITYGRQHMIDKYGAVESHGAEADDYISIWAHECMEMEWDYVIAAIDKDLRQIPGRHFNYHQNSHSLIEPEEAYENLMLQCLTGDSGDNIPGIRGVGKVRAQQSLAGVPVHRQWNRVRAAWRSKKAGDPTRSWRLLKMLESWEELDYVKEQYGTSTTGEATVSEQDVSEESTQDS